MLQFNPAKRITVEEALEHPYMASLHHPVSPCGLWAHSRVVSTHDGVQEDEPVAEKLFNFDFEKEEMDKASLQRHIYEEVCAVPCLV